MLTADYQRHNAAMQWEPQYKCNWHHEDLAQLGNVLNDEMSAYFHDKYIDEIVCNSTPNDVARRFEEFFVQASQRTFGMQRVKPCRSKGPAWFDSECKRGRYEALQAGQRGHQECVSKCKEYRQLKQRKKRAFRQLCIDKIDKIHFSNKGDMWDIISSIAPPPKKKKKQPVNMPSGEQFLNHYKQLSHPV